MDFDIFNSLYNDFTLNPSKYLISVLTPIIFQLTIVKFFPKQETEFQKKLNLLRRLQHSVTAIIIICLAVNLPLKIGKICLTIGTILMFSFDFYRISNKEFNEKFIKGFIDSLRPSEYYSITGSSYFLLGLNIVMLVFSIDIFYISAFILGFGDPASGIIGQTFRSFNLRKDRSFLGTFGGALVSTFSIYIGSNFFSSFDCLFSEFLVGFTLCFLISALSELFPSILNDNLSTPIYSAIFFWLSTNYLGITCFN